MIASGFISSTPEEWGEYFHAAISKIKLIHPLDLEVLKKAIPEWPWPRMPQAMVKVPDEYQKQFVDLLFADRGWDWKTKAWDFDTKKWVNNSDALHVNLDDERDVPR